MQGVELCETTFPANPGSNGLRLLPLDDESDPVGVNHRLKFPFHWRTDMHFNHNIG